MTTIYLKKSNIYNQQQMSLQQQNQHRQVTDTMEEYVYRVLNAIPSTNLKADNEDLAYRQELEAMSGHRDYRITQMFSATMPIAIERLAKKFLRYFISLLTFIHYFHYSFNIDIYIHLLLET